MSGEEDPMLAAWGLTHDEMERVLMGKETTVLDDARREYADWYVREELARREAKNWRQGRAMLTESWAKQTAELLAAAGYGPDVMAQLCTVGDWLVAEAEYHRMHAEAVLRSYGAPVL